MGKKWLLICVVCMAAFFALFGCNQGDSYKIGDGTGNFGSVIDGVKPVFSSLGGFFKDHMTVTISLPNAFAARGYEIRCTFNGSEPNIASWRYDGGEILLPHAQAVRTQFRSGDDNVSVTVLRAACFDSNGDMVGQIATATYIQSSYGIDRFKLPVISLVTDDQNLSYESIGILHPNNTQNKGKEWDRPVHVELFEADGSLAIDQDAAIRLFGGSSRGMVQKSFRITARKSDFFEKDCYDGAGKFHYALFPGRLKADGTVLQEYDSFVLRNGGNDAVFTGADPERATFLRDGLAHLIADEAAPRVDNMAYRPAVVFLNGEYYGLLNMRETQNNKYIQNVYDIEDEAGIAVLSSELDATRGGRYDGTWFYLVQDDGPEGELENFTQLMQGILNGRYTYDEVSRYIDLDNFMQYCAVNLFLCNTDWPHNNVKLWRYAGYSPGQYADAKAADGRWRFLFKDMDLGLSRYVIGTVAENPVELYTRADSDNIRFMLWNYRQLPSMLSGYPSTAEHSYPDSLYLQGLFAFCLLNETFLNNFKEYCRQLAVEIWPPERLVRLIKDSMNAVKWEMEPYMNKNFGTYPWTATTDFSTWQNAILGSDSLLTWTRERSGADGYFLKLVSLL